MTSPLSLPSGCLDIPPRLNITDHVVSRHVLLGRGDRRALECDGDIVSYAQLDEWTDRVAAALAALGIGAGDRFVLWSPNSVWYVLAVLAGMKAGAVPVLVDSAWNRRRVETVVQQTGAQGVLLTPELSEQSVAGLPTLDLAQSDVMAGLHEPVEAGTRADDVAYMTCELSAEGEPRAVAWAHRVVIAAGDPIRYGLLRLTADDICLVPTELSGAFALDFAVCLPLSAGATTLIHHGAADPKSVLAAVETNHVTVLTGTRSLFRDMAALEADGLFDLTSVRLTVCLDGGLPPTLHDQLRRRLRLDVVSAAARPDTHVFAASPDGDRRPELLGLPLPGRKVEILTDAGSPAAPGEVGRLCFPSGDPALAAGCEGVDGWYRSDEFAYRDEGGCIHRAGKLFVTVHRK